MIHASQTFSRRPRHRHPCPPRRRERGIAEGSWLAEDINGGGVIDRLQTTLSLDADGKVTGMGGCNRYMGKATLKDDTISFGPMAGTRMACSPAVMNQENKFHAALETVRSWSIAQGKLFLRDESGSIVLRFVTMDKQKPK